MTSRRLVVPLLLGALLLGGCEWLWSRDNPCDSPAAGGFCLTAGGGLADWGKDIAVSAGGNSHVTGSFAGAAAFGPFALTARGKATGDAAAGGGTADVFVAQVSPAGAFNWAVSAGGDGADYANGVATDSGGNIYVTGSFAGTASFGSHVRTAKGQHDVFVAQLSPTGKFRWVVRAGGVHNDYANDIAVDSAGNSYIMGSFYKSAVFGPTALTAHGPNSFDVFVAQVSPQGKFRWALSAGGPMMDFGNGVAVDSGGNVYVTGEFAGQATFGGTTLTARGSHDVFVGKVSPQGKSGQGKFQWVISAGDVGHDYGKGVTVDSGGNVYVTGEFTRRAVFGATTLQGPGGMFFAAKVSPGGAGGKGVFTWARTAGDMGEGRGNRVAVDAAGNGYVTGQLTSEGEGDVLIWKLAK